MTEEVSEQIIKTIREFLGELNIRSTEIKMDSDFENTFGLGSLERSHLLGRLEDCFGQKFPDKALLEVRSARDLLRFVGKTSLAQNQNQKQKISFSDDLLPKDSTLVQVPSPEEVSTLVDLVKFRAQTKGEENHVYLLDDDLNTTSLSYLQLWQESKNIAASLIKLGLCPQDRVAIILPTSLDFLTSFMGILTAGGVAVPIYPPVQVNQALNYFDRYTRVLEKAGVRFCITDTAFEPVGKIFCSRVDSLQKSMNASQLKKSQDWEHVRVSPSNLAFLQYTSGSTGDPKGVALTHANLLANMHAIGQGLEANKEVVVSWLPLYHDLGLIGCWLTSLLYGATVVLMSPLQFLSRPERWLWAIDRFKATMSAAPNFGYELLCRKVKDEDLSGLDLSSWNIAINGAERILPDTIERFYERFKDYGLKSTVMFPVYGLAETCLGLTVSPRNREARVDHIKRDLFLQEGQAIPVNPDENIPQLSFVSLGKPLPTQEIQIVPIDNPYEKALPERTQGRILMNGPSVMQGYFQEPEKTAQIQVGKWIDTGDLGYLSEGELFFTGRVKDIIIKGGINYHPEDIERAIWKVPGVRKGCVVAFSVLNSQKGELVVAVVETKNRHPSPEMPEQIRQAVQEAVATPCDEVVLVPSGTIPKTSSGKLRRQETKKLYLEKTLLAPQYSRKGFFFLGLELVYAYLRSVFATTITKLYSLWAKVIPLLIVLLGIPSLLLCPGKRLSWLLLRVWAKILLFSLGIPLRKSGPKIPSKEAILVSNHTSYYDAFFLISVCPYPFRIVVREEDFHWPLVGRIYKKLGFIPIKRTNEQTFVQSYAHLQKAAEDPELIHIFPEGTFLETPSLLPFRLGAFQIAAEKKLPIVPIALKGSRMIIKRRTQSLSWGAVDIEVLSPLLPQENSLQEAARLRDEARRLIAEACQDPLNNLQVVPKLDVNPLT